MADTVSKWSCEKCTYDNFPAALKCVVCNHSRVNHSTTQNIYNLIGQQHSEAKADTINSCESIVRKENETSDKWTCSKCTFMNSMWLVKCGVCRIDRYTPQSPPNQTRNSSTSPRNSRKAHSPGATSAQRLASYLPKWRCTNCTYDNFPKSLKCSLCQRAKSASLENSPTEDQKSQSCSESEISATGGRGHSPDPVSPQISPRDPVMNLNLNGPHHSERKNASTSKAKTSSSSDQRRRNSPIASADTTLTFINACKSICDGKSDEAINMFLLYGGDPRQKATLDDVNQLSDGDMDCKASPGQTLIELAAEYNREDLVQLLLTAIENKHSQKYDQSHQKLYPVFHRRRLVLPCQLSPELASDVRLLFGAGLRQAKEGAFPCYYFSRDPVTFSLPQEVYSLPVSTRKQLFEDIVDHQVQHELEAESVINWSAEVVFNLGSRLYTLNNRAAGDCLLDAVMQTVWGVMDRSNVLRRAMSSALYEAENPFWKCWRSYESTLNERLGCTLDESQWDATWQKLLDLANNQGQPLEELHIFVLAHVLRRPIIVYSPSFVTSRVSGDKIGVSSFQGVYLPLLWDRQFCHRNPISLAYTLGHFSALVSVQSDEVTVDPRGSGQRAVYLPLQESNGNLFQVHFSAPRGPSSTRRLLTDWLDCWKTCRTNVLVAQQKLECPPLAVRQMLTDWLARYSSTAVFGSENQGEHSFGLDSTPSLSPSASPQKPTINSSNYVFKPGTNSDV